MINGLQQGGGDLSHRVLFCLTCVDLKMLEMRIKVRHLNDAIPDFSDMIIFSKEQNARKIWIGNRIRIILSLYCVICRMIW